MNDSEPRGQRDPGERRLAAVAFLDIVGYSTMMAEDEHATHAAWMTMLGSVVKPLVAAHRGRLIKSTGDGVLVEFASGTAAVAWACEVQRRPVSSSVDARSLSARISVHVGDVFTTADDIYGDGVNVAARLQEWADPDCVVVSDAVYDLVRGDHATDAIDLGLLHVRGHVHPVRAWQIGVAGVAASPRLRLLLDGLPSIAVLPLQDLGASSEHSYFAEGVVEDITTSLSNLREVMVIAHASASRYVGGRVDPQQVGRDLGVRYVAYGTVVRGRTDLRIAIQLADTASGQTLWGHKASAPLDRLFDLHDEIVSAIVAGIAPNVREAELQRALRKRPEKFSAYDCVLRAFDIVNRLDRAAFPQARALLQRAMDEDPGFAMARAWAARWHSLCVGQGWADDPAAESARAVELAGQAIALDPHNALALATFAHLRSYLYQDSESALHYFDRALVACPNSALAWILSSGTLSYLGRCEEAVARANQALRLSPFDRGLFYYYMFLSLAHYGTGDYEAAIKWGRVGLNANPLYTATSRVLAAAFAATGRMDEAREAAGMVLAMEPNFRLSTYAGTRQPFREPTLKARFMGHLKAAGLPN